MQWYNYFAGFWSGMFLANFVPHFVTGICGNKFPTPFAKPPGIGLSSSTVNVLWSLFNLIIGFVLFKASHISINDNLSLSIFFAGIALMSLYASKRFTLKHKE